MRKLHRAYRVFLGILIISLVIPLSPPISLAKAKVCCKTKCGKTIHSVTQSEQKPVEHCEHKNNPIDCCQENCSNVIGHENSNPASILNTPPKVESLTLVACLAVSLDRISTIPANFLFHSLDSSIQKTKTLPLFITHSSLII